MDSIQVFRGDFRDMKIDALVYHYEYKYYGVGNGLKPEARAWSNVVGDTSSEILVTPIGTDLQK